LNNGGQSQINQETDSNPPELNGKKKNEARHHREIITTVENGVKHVQITEVHVGGDFGGSNFNHIIY
jgi:hypothetical protein